MYNVGYDDCGVPVRIRSSLIRFLADARFRQRSAEYSFPLYGPVDKIHRKTIICDAIRIPRAGMRVNPTAIAFYDTPLHINILVDVL